MLKRMHFAIGCLPTHALGASIWEGKEWDVWWVWGRGKRNEAKRIQRLHWSSKRITVRYCRWFEYRRGKAAMYIYVHTFQQCFNFTVGVR